MRTECTAKRISPMLVVTDMPATLTFYRSILGFEPMLEGPAYSIMQRDGQTIHFQVAPEEIMNRVRGHTEIYLEVSGIESLWEHVKAFKGSYRIRDLFVRDYGMTEFHIEDPNGCLIFVGEPTSTESTAPRP